MILLKTIVAQLIIKPSEPIILRDQYKSFVASCTGQPNTRVGQWEEDCVVRVLRHSLLSSNLAISITNRYRRRRYRQVRSMSRGIRNIFLSLSLSCVCVRRVTVERQTYGLRLRIRNLTRSDQGIWECLGSDQDGRPLSRSLQVNVKGDLDQGEDRFSPRCSSPF